MSNNYSDHNEKKYYDDTLENDLEDSPEEELEEDFDEFLEEETFAEDLDNPVEDHSLDSSFIAKDEKNIQDNEEDFTENEDFTTATADLKLDSFEDFITKNNVRDSENKPVVQNLDELSLQVRCEVGTISMTLEELYNLKVGDYIEFIKWPGRVKLLLNDYLFAEGYLVEVDGMLGVKITNNLGALNSVINS